MTPYPQTLGQRCAHPASADAAQQSPLQGPSKYDGLCSYVRAEAGLTDDFRRRRDRDRDRDGWSDDVRLSDIEPLFTRKSCGKRGADIRPSFSEARMGAG